MSFSELGLRAEILKAIEEQGYTSPTPIQAKAIPAVLARQDLLAAAQTGTGKTAGFTLPLLQLLSEDKTTDDNKSRPIRALILTPTRELAAQIQENVQAYSQYLPLTSFCIFGGVNINPQIKQLKKGVDMLVATPGRLLDHVQQKTIDLSHIQYFVLDEADRMLDMGFIHDVKKVLAVLPAKRQTLLFSATFSDDIKALAQKLLDHPTLIEVAKRNSTVEIIQQSVIPVARDKKHALLANVITTRKWSQVLVFTRTKHGANKLVEQLEKLNIKALAIHGNKSQAARTKALDAFKNKQIDALIATDIAARGIDIDQLPYVVNYDLPNVAEDYVHRIGRTGRAGAEGTAVSLVSVDEKQLLKDIEKFTHQSIPVEIIDGFTPDPSEKPQPIQLRTKEHQQRQQRQRSGSKPAGSKPRSAGANARPEGSKPRSAGSNSRPEGSKPRSGGANARPASSNKPANNNGQRRQNRPPKKSPSF